MKAWPASAEGHADSLHYLAMLDAASREGIRRFDARSDEHDRLQTMAIEFSISAKEASFSTFTLDIVRDGDEVTITTLEPIATTLGSRAYVARAMRLQAEAAFGTLPPELGLAIGPDR